MARAAYAPAPPPRRGSRPRRRRPPRAARPAAGRARGRARCPARAPARRRAAAAAAARRRASRAPRAISSRASSRCAAVACLGLAAPGGQPVGAGEQRHLHLHRLGALEVAVDLAAVERALVDEEAEHEVVAGQGARRSAPGARSCAGAGRASRTISLAQAVVAHEGDAPVGADLARGGLADVVQQRAEAQRLAARELVGERLAEHARAAGGCRVRARARSAGAAPRACGRRRRGGGSGSAPPRAARVSSGSTAREQPEPVGQREAVEHAVGDHQAAQLGEDALAGGLGHARRRGRA